MRGCPSPAGAIEYRTPGAGFRIMSVTSQTSCACLLHSCPWPVSDGGDCAAQREVQRLGAWLETVCLLCNHVAPRPLQRFVGLHGVPCVDTEVARVTASPSGLEFGEYLQEVFHIELRCFRRRAFLCANTLYVCALMLQHCRSGMGLSRRFLVDSIAVYLDYHEESILDDYKIRLNPPILLTTSDEHWQRGKRNSGSFESPVKIDLRFGSEQQTVGLAGRDVVGSYTTFDL